MSEAQITKGFALVLAWNTLEEWREEKRGRLWVWRSAREFGAGNEANCSGWLRITGGNGREITLEAPSLPAAVRKWQESLIEQERA